jgi:hypothetical protein
MILPFDPEQTHQNKTTRTMKLHLTIHHPCRACGCTGGQWLQGVLT